MINIVLALFSGLLAALLINYLADVLPYRRRLVTPFCLQCQATLPPAVYLRGQPCPQCGHRSNRLRHRLTLLTATAFYAWLWLNPSGDVMPTENAVAWARGISFVLTVLFGLIIVIDIEHLVVLDEVNLAGGVIAIVLGTWLHGWRTTLAGGLGGFLLMYALYKLGELYLHWRRQRNPGAVPEDEVALGFGDVKLTAALGLLLGWPDILLVLLLAFLVAGLFAILALLTLVIQRKNVAAAAMPYTPYLILVAAWLLLL